MPRTSLKAHLLQMALVSGAMGAPAAPYRGVIKTITSRHFLLPVRCPAKSNGTGAARIAATRKGAAINVNREPGQLAFAGRCGGFRVRSGDLVWACQGGPRHGPAVACLLWQRFDRDGQAPAAATGCGW